MGRIRQRTARRENDGQIQALVSDCDRLNQEVSSSVTLFLWFFHCLRLSCPWARCSTRRCFSRPAQYSATDTVDTWTEGEAGRTEREQLWTLVTHREVSESLIERILITVWNDTYRTSMFPSVSNTEALRSQVKLRVGNKTPKPTFLQIGPF